MPIVTIVVLLGILAHESYKTHRDKKKAINSTQPNATRTSRSDRTARRFAVKHGLRRRSRREPTRTPSRDVTYGIESVSALAVNRSEVGLLQESISDYASVDQHPDAPPSYEEAIHTPSPFTGSNPVSQRPSHLAL